jgi:hypothetical protein
MLEGRVLDVTTSGLQRDERLAMKAAIEALIEQFGQNSWHLREYGRRLADILGVPECSPRFYLQPPPPVAPTYEPPVPVQLALGQAARDKAPLPAAWALTALTADITTPKRVPLTRCAPEFAALFEVRFQTAFPDGLRLRASRHPLRLNYRPLGFSANAAQPVRLDALVPEACVTDFTPVQRSTLSDLLKRCADELSDYSRHLGKVADARETPEAQLKLPEPLLTQMLQKGLPALNASAKGAAVTIEDAARALWGPAWTVPPKAVPALKALLAKAGLHVVASTGRRLPDKANRSLRSKQARVQLDETLLKRIKDDDARAAALLAGVFTEECDAPSAATTIQPAERVAHALAQILPSLDAVHLDLLEALLQRDTWSSNEVEALASARALMAQGALEYLNDAAFDAFGEPLLTSDMEVELHTSVASPLRLAASGVKPS